MIMNIEGKWRTVCAHKEMVSITVLGLLGIVATLYYAKIRPGPFFPFVSHLDAVIADEVDRVEGTSYGVEAGCVDEHVEFVLLVRRLDALFGDAFYRCLEQIDQVHVLAIVGFVIERLHWYTPRTKPVILRDQRLCRRGIVDPLSDLFGDEIRDKGVGRFITEHLLVV